MTTPVNSLLTREQAERLLSPLGRVEVVDVIVVPTTNDVFRVPTAGHGTFYMKFHTARWYAEHPDTAFVIERECASAEILRKRGLALPYRIWGDCSRTVVSRSVLVSEELGGLPVTDALRANPSESSEILFAFGQHMRRLHEIEFTNAGLLSKAHADVCPEAGRVPFVPSWDKCQLHHASIMQREALEMVEKNARLIPNAVVPLLRSSLSSLADIAAEVCVVPRLTIGNCHAFHFHVAKTNTVWRVLGSYDFEAASAGDPDVDLIEIEVILTPVLGSTTWRAAFFDGYGEQPGLELYKRRLFYYFLFELDRPSSKVPDPEWFSKRWLSLLNARDWSELEWYPTKSGAT